MVLPRSATTGLVRLAVGADDQLPCEYQIAPPLSMINLAAVSAAGHLPAVVTLRATRGSTPCPPPASRVDSAQVDFVKNFPMSPDPDFVKFFPSGPLGS